MPGITPARSLTWRLLIWMAAIGLGPLLVVTALGYRGAGTAIRELGDRHLRSVLDSRKARLERWRVEVESDFGFLAVAPCTVGTCNRTPDDGTPLGAACCDFLQNVRKRDRIYRSIASFDEAWRLVSDSPGAPPIDGRTLPAAFKAGLRETRGFAVSDAKRRGTIAEAYAGHPILHDDRIVGFVVARLDLTSVVMPILADRNGLGETGRARVFYAGDGGAPDGMPSSGEPVEYRDAERQRFGAATAIEGLGLLVVDIESAEAFELTDTLGRQALRTGLLTLAAIIGLAFLAARWLSRPLRDLADASRRIAHGDRKQRLAMRGTAEDRDVASAFNGMLDELDAAEVRVRQQASLAAVGSLSTSIVHEMRNPLASIKLNLGPLAAQAADDPAHAELASIANAQVARLEGMLSDLLQYGRPLEPAPAPMRFRDLVDDVLVDVRGELVKREIEPTIRDELGKHRLHVDPELMRRVLGNLVENAIAAAPPAGRIDVRAHRPDDAPGQVEIIVRDNGPGVPEDHLTRVFEPFFTTRDGGTGIGLANVKKIVEYHGGHVAVANDAAGGARFTVRLPVK